MFLQGYRFLTISEVDARMKDYEAEADKQRLEGEERKKFLLQKASELVAEKVEIQPIENTVKFI